MAGILTQCRGKVTKKGSMMGFLVLEDLTGSIEGLVFPKVYEKYAPMLSSDSPGRQAQFPGKKNPSCWWTRFVP